MNQAQLWNPTRGCAWVDLQPALDAMLEPFVALLGTAPRVLDVGCGTGATTLALAREAERCTGIDISEPMLARALERAAEAGVDAEFILGDAQTYPFAAGSFDLVVSRFGVMFFEDPVAAFANLRRAGSALRAIAWRAPAENPFMTTASRAAAPLLDLPSPPPDGPGQFAFADPARVERILADAGWREIALEPVDVPCEFAEADLLPYVARLGPVGMALADQDAATRERVLGTVRAAFEPFVDGARVRFTAACWRISAAAPAR